MTDEALRDPGERLAERELPVRSRRALPPGAAYWLAAAVIGLCLFASVVPSPLYHLYAVTWHFSSLTLTLIYATYAFGVLAALLTAGRVSDQVGRRHPGRRDRHRAERRQRRAAGPARTA
jgi:MFS family permease